MKRKDQRISPSAPLARGIQAIDSKMSDCSSRVKWDLYRRVAPELFLVRFPGGDDLSFLFWGHPDAELSFRTYRMVKRSLAARSFSDATTHLLSLYRASAATFHKSRWVYYTLGELALEDESATKRFLKTYRRLKRPTPKLLKAYDAAAILKDKQQRKHWLQAVIWFANFYENYDRHKSEKRFTADAAVKYAESRDVLNVDVEALVAIAHEVFQNLESETHVLVDRAVSQYSGIQPQPPDEDSRQAVAAILACKATLRTLRLKLWWQSRVSFCCPPTPLPR